MGSFFLCTLCLSWRWGVFYVGLIQGHPMNKQHCLLLSGKTFPKPNTVAACLGWSIHAGPWDICCFFYVGYCAKAFSRKYLRVLSYSINVKQYSIFPGTRTCVLQGTLAQVLDFQCKFSSQSKIPQINWRIWGLIFFTYWTAILRPTPHRTWWSNSERRWSKESRFRFTTTRVTNSCTCVCKTSTQ